MLGKGHGGLYKAPTKEERRKQKAERRERSDQVYYWCDARQFFSFLGPDHMMSLSRNEEFKNIFLNALTSYDQLSRLADIVSNCNEEDNVTDQLSGGNFALFEVIFLNKVVNIYYFYVSQAVAFF